MESSQNAYESLMSVLNGPKSIEEAAKEKQTGKNDYNDGFNEHHQAQTELVSWLQTHKSQNGLIGKRKPLERENLDAPLVENNPNQRRRVVVRPRKLIDE